MTAETDALADHLRMTVPALSASLAERLAEGLRPFLAEVWDDGSIARAEADPWATVRHLNPYRTQVEERQVSS